ncbi:hypothetical protein BJX76DRAFT_343821, partial [Aspergillus varians]
MVCWPIAPLAAFSNPDHHSTTASCSCCQRSPALPRFNPNAVDGGISMFSTLLASIGPQGTLTSGTPRHSSKKWTSLDSEKFDDETDQERQALSLRWPTIKCQGWD